MINRLAKQLKKLNISDRLMILFTENINMVEHNQSFLKTTQGGKSTRSEQSIELTAASFREGLTIVELDASSFKKVNILYNFNVNGAGGGLIVNESANEYVVNHNGLPASPTLVVESLDNIGVYGSPIPNMMPYPGAPTAVSLKSFSFSLPPGFTAPFRLIIT